MAENESKVLGCKVAEDYKAELRKLAYANGYTTLSEFVRQAIRELETKLKAKQQSAA